MSTTTKRSSLLLQIVWLISLLCLLATLYLSEIKEWPVCHLCWYQRICLYPQVILLGMAVYRQSLEVIPYAIGLLWAGFFFAFYQTLEQHIPALQTIGLCGQGPDCSAIHMHWFGFLTLPMLSTIGFAFLISFLTLIRRTK